MQARNEKGGGEGRPEWKDPLFEKLELEPPPRPQASQLFPCLKNRLLLSVITLWVTYQRGNRVVLGIADTWRLRGLQEVWCVGPPSSGSFTRYLQRYSGSRPWGSWASGGLWVPGGVPHSSPAMSDSPQLSSGGDMTFATVGSHLEFIYF